MIPSPTCPRSHFLPSLPNFVSLSPASSGGAGSCRQLPIAPQMWSFGPTSFLHAGIWSGFHLLGFCVPSWPLRVHMCSRPAVSRGHWFLVDIYCLWLLHSLYPLLSNDPRVFGGEGTPGTLHLGLRKQSSALLFSALSICLVAANSHKCKPSRLGSMIRSVW